MTSQERSTLRVQVYADAVAHMREQGASDAAVTARVLQAASEACTAFSPELLLERGVPVSRTVQQPGEFVVVWPRAYHFGFAHGQFVAESSCFAALRWAEFGAEAAIRSLHLARPMVRAYH
jgi:JmjC domain, hydroxylase